MLNRGSLVITWATFSAQRGQVLWVVQARDVQRGSGEGEAASPGARGLLGPVRGSLAWQE